MSKQVVLTLGSLARLDNGKVGLIIEQALRTAALDCAERPGDKTPRNVNLIIGIRPVAVERNLEEVEVEVVCKVSVPKTRTRGYRMGYEQTGELVYSDHNTDDRRQAKMPFVTEEPAAVDELDHES